MTASHPERHYLDAATVAPIHPRARQALLAAIDDGWADPRRLHHEGRRARLLLDGAREAIAAQLGARTEEVAFTGSHAAAVHAAVLGVQASRRRPGVIVASAVEHSTVLHAAGWAGVDPGGTDPDDADASGTDQPPGAGVRLIGVDRLGRVDVDSFAAALRSPALRSPALRSPAVHSPAVHSPAATLACLQAANSEVGTLQPVAEVLDHCEASGTPLLMDATAAAGQLPLPTGWNLLTADPRSWGAPAGVGVLVIRAGTRWRAPGPPDEDTEPVPGAVNIPVALAAAVALQAVSADRERADRQRELIDRIRRAAAAVDDVEVAGDPIRRLPHVVTFSCLYCDGETLVGEFDRLGFAVGSGSACTASSLEPSHVLAAMGLLTHGNVRVGLAAQATPAQVDEFCAALPGVVRRVRALLGAQDL